MASITVTHSTYDSNSTSGGNREDLEDVIYDLFPDETFMLTNLEKTSATATFHEWLGDTLAPAASNIQIEGDDVAEFATVQTANRYGNYCQIFRKEFLISGTQEKVAKAGRRSDVSRQAVKQMRELKNDVEYALVRNQASTAGSASVGRSLGSIESWIGATTASSTAATIVVRATSTADSASTPALTGGTPGAAPTDGSTTGAFVEGSLKLALEGAWNNGGQTDTILVSASVKNTINGFSSIATRQVDVGRTAQASITGAADIYVSNFGTHRIRLHRHVRTSVCLCLDTSLWGVATLRGFRMQTLAQTGDGEKRMLLWEGTLRSNNYLGNSKVVAIA